MQKMLDKIDIAIVGGGPAGLAAACALARRCPKLRVRVFERSPCVPKKGAGLAVYPNGAAALTSISPDLASKVWNKACRIRLLAQTVDQEDKVLTEAVLDWGANKPENQVLEGLVPWYELTKTLADDLPDGVIQFDRQLIGLELPHLAGTRANGTDPETTETTETSGAAASSSGTRTASGDGNVRLTFANGTTAEAALVVGCDGLLSQTRRLWLRNHEGPKFQGTVVLRGRLSTTVLQQLPGWPQGVTSRRYNAGGGHAATVYSVDDATSVWAMYIPYTTLQARDVNYAPYGARRQVNGTVDETEFAATSAYEEATKLVTLFAPSLERVVKACDPTTCTLSGIYAMPPDTMPERKFGTGPVTLLGDAAHSMPVAGQGANLAIEDAVVLAYYIQRLGPSQAALRAYEADRAPRVKRCAQHIEYVMGMMKAAKGAEDVVKQQQQKNQGRSFEYVAEVHGFEHPCLHG